MAPAKIFYNGTEIGKTEEDDNISVSYCGENIGNIFEGETKVFACGGKVMLSDLLVGTKTLFCKAMKMASDIEVFAERLFPAEPSAYSLLGTYTAATTWKAPEDGWFQVELFGASGNGGTMGGIGSGAGGGGGGGGCAISRIALKAGDTVVTSGLAIGGTAKAAVNSSYDDNFDHTLSVTSGANGSNGTTMKGGAGGAGGKASGGNYANYNGGTGGAGGNMSLNGNTVPSGGTGGTAGYTGGRTGGTGEDYSNEAGSGSKAFMKVYRGNTNLG